MPANVALETRRVTRLAKMQASARAAASRRRIRGLEHEVLQVADLGVEHGRELGLARVRPTLRRDLSRRRGVSDSAVLQCDADPIRTEDNEQRGGLDRRLPVGGPVARRFYFPSGGLSTCGNRSTTPASGCRADLLGESVRLSAIRGLGPEARAGGCSPDGTGCRRPGVVA